MRSWSVCSVFASAVLSLGAEPGPAPPEQENRVAENIGLYTNLVPRPEMIPFLRACGYNVYEWLDHSFSVPPEDHDAYFADAAAGIRQAQKAGFRTYVILLSNMEQRYRDRDPIHPYGLFPPLDEAAMSERLDFIRAAVERLRHADGFIFFPGDPGGDPGREADADDCLAMARSVRRIVHESAPEAEFIFNAWAIAAWQGFPSPFTVEFWDLEVEITRAVIGDPAFADPAIGIEFPLHNYYRSLALDLYAKAERTPPLCPTPEDVAVLRRRGLRHLWGWPYFLVDECDDGYRGETWGQAQSETRYLREVVAAGRRLGLDGMVANASTDGLHPEVLNLYAFARFCLEPELTPLAVIREFAGKLADRGSVEDLVHVLCFIENHCTWQDGLPVSRRLPDLPSAEVTDAEQALAALARVQPLAAARLPMPEAPSDYLKRLQSRLENLAAEP